VAPALLRVGRAIALAAAHARKVSALCRPRNETLIVDGKNVRRAKSASGRVTICLSQRVGKTLRWGTTLPCSA
jgi:hypothetical protein